MPSAKDDLAKYKSEGDVNISPSERIGPGRTLMLRPSDGSMKMPSTFFIKPCPRHA